jgi:hypothetical protein
MINQTRRETVIKLLDSIQKISSLKIYFYLIYRHTIKKN